MILTFTYLQVKDAIDDTNANTLCISPFFMLMNAGGEITTLIFIVIGIIISCKAK